MQLLLYSIFHVLLYRIISLNTFPGKLIEREKLTMHENILGIILEELLLRIPLLLVSNYFGIPVLYPAFIFSIFHLQNYSTSTFMSTKNKIIMVISQCLMAFILFLYISEFNLILGMIFHLIYNLALEIIFHFLGKAYLYIII